MAITLIKQIPDDYAEMVGLSKYNRSRMPGCRDRFSPAFNEDNGRYTTGLDENVVPQEKREKLKALRENLEKITQKDLSATSKYWEDFMVTIDSDKPKTFNDENPLDIIKLKVLIANKNVAPSFEATSDPVYRDAQYYAYTEEGEAKKEVSVLKKRDFALSALSAISDSKDKMIMYGQYLEGLKYTDQLNEDVVYKMLRAYIEDDKKPDHVQLFLDITKKTPEELQQKVLVDRAFKQRLITKQNLGGKRFAYQYGQVTVGINVEDVYKNLALPQYAGELMAIKKELER